MEPFGQFVNVIDVEATCWETKTPPDQTSEIIEIGLCVLNTQTFERTEKRSIIVKPVRSSISAFCTKLTGWTQAQVDTGVSFAEACQILKRDFRSDSRTWLSWGDYDRNQFTRQCKATGTPYPFSARHINAKQVFALARNEGRKLGMAGAFKVLGWSLEGRHHNGADDAWNIARVIAELVRSNELRFSDVHD
jgi:inhibitor of KinA sporulation pathway (predicted exonuclease)